MLSENGYLYLSYMEGDKEGFEKTSFTGNDTLYIHYFSENFLKHNLDKEGFEIIYLHKQPYHEMDGTITTDTILFARKK
jgi:hypothetical protein